MKSILMVFMISLLGIWIVSSCGSVKNAVQLSGTSEPFGKAVEQDVCVELAEQNPAKRAWGDGEHFQLTTARNLAELQARAGFAKAIASQITTSAENQANGTSQYNGDTSVGEVTQEQAAIINDLAKGVAKELIVNTVVIKSSVYQKSNKQYHVFVCLEYQKDISQMADDVAQKAATRLSDEQKLKIHFDMEQYRKRVEDELKNYKGVTTQ